MRKLKFFLVIWYCIGYGTQGYPTISPRKFKIEPTTFPTESHLQLQEFIQEAFNDALKPEEDDLFNNGIAESDETILIFGERIRGRNVTEFCGSLAEDEWREIPEKWRDGVRFKPVKDIPLPVVNLTIQLPTRWFRKPCNRTPRVYICYEGHRFLKLDPLKPDISEWVKREFFRESSFQDPRNEKIKIREILVVMDDYWHNRCLLPSYLDARAIFQTEAVVKRVTYDRICDEKLGFDQPCCLFKFTFTDATGPREFHRCLGSVPLESLKSNQIPDDIANLLMPGGFTRRFLSPPERVCRDIEFKPMEVKGNNGQVLKLDRLGAVKCATFY